MNTYIKKIKELIPLMEGADHYDIKSMQIQITLREFIAVMLSYSPWWIRLLIQIREVLVRILGLERHPKQEKSPHWLPEEIPFTVNEPVDLFIVRFARENEYWVTETPEDKHLRAYIAVIMEPLKESTNRFHVLTIVKYKHWTGPVYFNLIRPFHHLVVRRMMKAVLKKSIQNK
jgi:hypothetical protein